MSQKQQTTPGQQAQPIGNTTNLTLNMNFNLQQSTIQMQPVGPALQHPPRERRTDNLADLADQHRHRGMYQSTRSSQSMLVSQPPTGLLPHHMTPQQLSASKHGGVKSPEITSMKLQSPKTFKVTQIRGRVDKQDLPGTMSPPPNLSTGKVKKIKVNQLNAQQLNQIRTNQESNKVNNTSNQALLSAQHSELRTNSVGRNAQYAQMALSMQQQNQALDQPLQMSPSNYLQQVPLHDNLSARQSKNYLQSSTQSPGLPHGLDSESKLGRKGERPTVAQILEIGDQSWIETDRNGQQPLSRLTLNSMPQAYNATVTSNFESIGRSTFQASNEMKQSKQKGVSMDYVRSPQMKTNSPHQASLNQSQFRRMRKSKRKHDNEVSHGHQHLDMTQPSSSMGKVTDQILNSTTAAATRSRQDQQKMHYSEGMRLHNGIASPHGGYSHHQQQHQQQQPAQQPATFIPLLLDVNQRGGTQATAASQEQLFSRIQQQFLSQATIIRHPQMGELPVIQMTQQQLNQMVQQAAQHRQNYQSDQQQQQAQQHGNNGGGPAAPNPSGATSGFHTMAQMLAAQGLPINSQMAFAIQVQEPTHQQAQPQQHTPKHHGHMGSPHMAGYSQHPHGHYQLAQQQHIQQQQQQQHCQLPSLRHPNHMQHHSTNQSLSPAHMRQAGQTQYQQMMSPAPIKKMTLNSRGKSVPRNNQHIESEQSSAQQNVRGGMHHHHQILKQPAYAHHTPLQQQQYQQYQEYGHHPGYPVNNARFYVDPQQPLKGHHVHHHHQNGHHSHVDSRQQQFQMTQTGGGTQQQPPLLAPLQDKSHRNSMQFVQSPEQSVQGPQRNDSQLSRSHLETKHHYVKLNLSANTTGSRSLVTQSDHGSGRSKQAANNSNMQPGNVYVAYKGPLSDILMTQQRNMNQAAATTNPSQHHQSYQHKSQRSGSGLRIGKSRKKSSSVTCRESSRSGEPPENSSHQDMNGGIPYIFENQKITSAINQEELKVVKQHLEMTGAGCSSIIIGELQDMEKQNQTDFVVPAEPKPKKKVKGRKGGGFNASQNKTQLSKSSADAMKIGQRQLNQQPHQQIASGNMQHMVSHPEQRITSKSKKKFSGTANQSLIQSHAESSYLEQQQQIMHFQEDNFAHMTQQHINNLTPTNLKPNNQVTKAQSAKKELLTQQQPTMIQEAQGPSEPSLAQHGQFMKTLAPACSKYYKSKNNSRMTPYKYKSGISSRLLVARETFVAKRAKLPIMVINIDGVLGYFDEQKNYQCRERSLHALQSLSHNFKIVGFSQESKGLISRFGRILADHKIPFAFDAIYQIQRKPLQNQNRLNLTQIILDFSSEEEEDLDMFVSSQIVLVTVDKAKLKEKFESMDLCEVFDYDKEYLRGAKAPLIIRLPHARCRPMSSLCFEILFQLLTCLIVTSKLGNLETTSLFTYNDRTKGLSIPTSDKSIVTSLLPERMKIVEKMIQQSKSLRFVMAEPPHGLNLHKGYKQLTEVYRGVNKPDWIDFNYRVFKPLLPIRMRLQKITQQTLLGAQPPTGKRLIVRCETEDATRRFQVFCKKNEIIRKQIRKYRARYWAVNMIEDMNLDEENQDIVGDLIDDALVATTLSDVVPEEPTSPSQIPNDDEEVATAALSKTTEQQSIENPGSDEQLQQPTVVEPSAPEVVEEEKVDEKLGGGACSSSSEASDSDNEHYDELAQAVKFKVIDIKHVVETDGNNQVKRQQTVKSVETNRPVKIECRKIPKPKVQVLLDFFSRKQNLMMFTTSQAQHLQGAATQQIESQITELVQKLNEADKAGKKEVFNYDF